MKVLRGTFIECASQAYELGLGIPHSAVRANGQWRWIYT